MSFPIQRFGLDKTGTNPANRIIGEEHILGPSRGMFHAVAPYYGPFYNSRTSWSVYKNGVEQIYGTDYFGVLMCVDETMVFNGEVDEIMLIKGAKEGDKITIHYQLLGGLYQTYARGLQDLWNAFLSDNRPVPWNNIIGLPNGFKPAYHLHMIDDVVGWQPVIITLERLINAVTLRNVPAFEALIEWVIQRNGDIVSTEEIYKMDPVDKLVSFARLLYAARHLNFNAITFRPDKEVILRNELLRMDISTTNLTRFHDLYWSILHETTTPEMFAVNHGTVGIDSNQGAFYVRPAPNYMGKDEVTFRLVLRQASATGPIISESKRIILRYNKTWEWDYGLLNHGSAGLLESEATLLSLPSPERDVMVASYSFWKAVENS